MKGRLFLDLWYNNLLNYFKIDYKTATTYGMLSIFKGFNV